MTKKNLDSRDQVSLRFETQTISFQQIILIYDIYVYCDFSKINKFVVFQLILITDSCRKFKNE